MPYNVRAPALPLQPIEYDKSQQDQFQNALRLYFNRLDDYLAALSTAGSTGGSQLYFPYGAFHQDGFTTLTNTIPNSSSTAAIVVGSTAMFASAGTILIGK